MNDRQLVQDFLTSKSEQAFLSLYRAKTPHLYRMALRLTQDEYKSEELIQEMWIVAIRKLEDFRWKSELKTWLTGILINLYRSMRRADEKELTSGAMQLSKAESGAFEWSEPVSDLEQAIAKLPPGYRQILILYDIEGYKHKEIASIMDISEGTSKSQLFYARKALRDYLSENFKPASNE